MRQKHTTHVRVIKSFSDIDAQAEADAVVTHLNGILLTVLTADCVPIVYVDPLSGVIGISHQGWKGTLGFLPSHVVKSMIDLGAKKERIYCVIGPCVGSCCYSIFGDRKQLFEKEFGTNIFNTNITGDGVGLDLALANRHTLERVGISKDHIGHVPFCTAEHNSSYFSLTRDKTIKGNMLNFIGYGL